LLEQKVKMNTVLEEIKYLRNMSGFEIDRRNNNRYRVLVKENIGRTAYCFSTPIYNVDSRKLINLTFDKSNDVYIFKGSNANVTVCKNRCVLENREGRAILLFDDIISASDSPNEINVAPCMNGLLFTVNSKYIKFNLKSEVKQSGVRFNSTCFSIMKDKFKPFLSLGTLYSTDQRGRFLPAEMKYKDGGMGIYEIEMVNEFSNGNFMFEVNLYEHKLFQDTTVESIHPDKNNVYGAVGFIGNTKQFGEQWLYSRLDITKIPEILSERIEKVILHIPSFYGTADNIDVFVPEKRFCSFGSTWNKKINYSERACSSIINGRYLTIDATNIFTNKSGHELVYNEGFIIKPQKEKKDFLAISTGDSYFAPQILEIKLKN